MKSTKNSNSSRQLKENVNSPNEECENIVGMEIPLENELNDMNDLVRNANQISLDDQINQLNIEQRHIFDEVVAYITQYCKVLDTNRSSTSSNPRLIPKNILRKFVTGVGGTGKSFLINIIRNYVNDRIKKDVVPAAPTGIAAFNVNGLTLHRLLQLPIEHDGVFRNTPLNDLKLEELRFNLKNCILLIIDEISMVSNVTLAFINQRLCEIFDTFQTEDGWFGRINILLFGDLLQLQPVNGEMPFVTIPQKVHNKHFDSLTSVNFWEALFSYDELIQNVRQQNDKRYGQALLEIRLGIVSKTTEELLRSREIPLNATIIEDCLNKLTDYITKLPKSTICLFATREQCAVLNSAMLSKIDSPKVLIKAHDKIEARTEKQKNNVKKKLHEWSIHKKSSLTAGLDQTIELKLGAKVMLLRNIEVSSGLVNGSIGIVKRIHGGTSIQPVYKLTILFDCGEREIEPIKIVIPMSNGAQVTRSIPNHLSICNHNSQEPRFDCF